MSDCGWHASLDARMEMREIMDQPDGRDLEAEILASQRAHRERIEELSKKTEHGLTMASRWLTVALVFQTGAAVVAVGHAVGAW